MIVKIPILNQMPSNKLYILPILTIVKFS